MCVKKRAVKGEKSGKNAAACFTTKRKAQPKSSALEIQNSKRCRPRRAVSRILSAARRSAWLCVHLSTPPKRSSRRSEMRHTRNHRRAARFPILPCTGMGLSSLHCYLWSGELLPPLFTLTSGKPEAVIFCDTIRHARLPSRAPAFTGNPALRCPDFPLTPEGTSERPHAEVDSSTLRNQATIASGKFRLNRCPHKQFTRQAPHRRLRLQ